MGITSSAPNGIHVRTSAKDSRLTEATLGSQTAADTNEIIVPNVIATNNEGNLEVSPTYVGRLIMIRPDRFDEEVRYVTAVDGPATTLTVHEDWVNPPVSGDDWALAYIIEDVATLIGMTLINFRTRDYRMSRRLTVGDDQTGSDVEGNLAWFALLDGASLEGTGFNSTSEGDFNVTRHGRWDNGYLAGGSPVSGGYLIPTTNAATLAFRMIDLGGVVRFYDFFITSVNNADMVLEGGDVVIQRAKMFGVNAELAARTSDHGFFCLFRDVILEGKNIATDDNVLLDDAYVFDGVIIANMNQALAVNNNISRLSRIRNVTVLANNAFLLDADDQSRTVMINPVWAVNDLAPHNTPDVGTFDLGASPTSRATEERFEVIVPVRDSAGAVVPLAPVYLTEETFGDGVQFSGHSDDGGNVVVPLLKRMYDIEIGTSVIGPFVTPNGFDFNENSPSLDTIVRNDGGSFLTDGFVVDGPVTVALATVAANDGTRRISAVTAGTITLSEAGVLTDSLDDNTATLQQTDHVKRDLRDGFGLHVHDYGKVPFVLPLVAFHGTAGVGDQNTQPQGTDIAAVTQAVSLPVDANIAAATRALALSNPTTDPAYSRHGPGETDTQPLKVIHYDGGTGGLPTEGEVITIANGGANTTGDLVEIVGDAVTGVMVLENWNGIEPDNNVTATGGSSTFSVTTDTTGGGSSFNEEYTIHVDCNDETLSVTYDFEAGVMGKPGKLSDYFSPPHMNAKLLHRTAANEWYAIVKTFEGKLQMLKSDESFGTSQLDDVDWFPVGGPFFPLGHRIDTINENRESFGIWSEVDGGDIHVMTISVGGAVSYHVFDPGTDAWTLQNEFVSRPADFSTGIDNMAGGFLRTRMAGCVVSFAVRSDGDIVAMVPAYGDTVATGGIPTENERGRFYAMTREGGTWTNRGEITTNTALMHGGSCQVFMDGSDLATFVWVQEHTPGAATRSLHLQTLSSTNVLGTVRDIDTNIGGSGGINAGWRHDIGLGIIDSNDRIYLPHIDSSGNITVSDWLSGTNPTFTQLVSPNDNSLPLAGRNDFPFAPFGLTVDSGNNVVLIYVDSTFDIFRDVDVDAAGTADTELQDGITCRWLSPARDPDGTPDDLYLYEEENNGFLSPVPAGVTAGQDENPGALKIGRGGTAMSNGTLLDIRNLILLWGLREHAQLLKFGAGGYFTDRHVGNGEGVWVSHRGAGTVDFMTSDGGTTFTPPVSISVTFDQMKDNSEIWVFPTGVKGEGNEIAMIENATAGSPDDRSFTWVAPASTVVDYIIHNHDPAGIEYETVQVFGFTVPATDVTIIIQQSLDRNASDE